MTKRPLWAAIARSITSARMVLNLPSVPASVRADQSGIPGDIGGENGGKAAARSHSSGIPALRKPAKYVVSNKARIFGTPPHAPGRAFR